MAAVVSSAKAYIDNMLSTVQDNLPAGSSIQWNGHSYTVRTSISSEELSGVLDRVSRTFWEKSSPVFQAQPKSWGDRYQAFVCLSEPVSDGMGGLLPTFIAGEALAISCVSKSHSLAKYTFMDNPILRRDDLAERLESCLGPVSKILWNGHSYTVIAPGDPKKIATAICGLWGSLDADPVTINEEKLIDPEGDFQPAVAFYKEVPSEVTCGRDNTCW